MVGGNKLPRATSRGPVRVKWDEIDIEICILNIETNEHNSSNKTKSKTQSLRK
jgi:hypothetical protein